MAVQNFGPGHCTPNEHWEKALRDRFPYQRGDTFRELLEDVTAGMFWMFNTSAEEQVYFMATPGTTALDLVIGSLPANLNCVVLDTGFFGQRLEQIARYHGMNVSVFKLPSGEGFNSNNASLFIDLINKTKSDVILAVHTETESGITNDIRSLAKVAHDYENILVMDGISSVGAEPLDLGLFPVDCYVGAAYKCLCGPASMSFVISNERYRRLAKRCVSYSLDLQRIERHNELRDVLWTPATFSLMVLRSFFESVKLEGKEQYFKRLHEMSELFWKTLSIAEIGGIGNPSYRNPCFAVLNSGNKTNDIVRKVLDQGIEVGCGLGRNKNSQVRIAIYPYCDLSDVQFVANVVAGAFQ